MDDFLDCHNKWTPIRPCDQKSFQICYFHWRHAGANFESDVGFYECLLILSFKPQLIVGKNKESYYGSANLAQAYLAQQIRSIANTSWQI